MLIQSDQPFPAMRIGKFQIQQNGIHRVLLQDFQAFGAAESAQQAVAVVGIGVAFRGKDWRMK